MASVKGQGLPYTVTCPHVSRQSVCGGGLLGAGRDRTHFMRDARVWAAAMVVLAILSGCEEMVREDDELQYTGRCYATAGWFIGKPIVRVYERGDRYPPELIYPETGEPVLDEDGDPEQDWSKMREVIDRYEGRRFTLDLFRKLQHDLYATGFYQDDNGEWGIEAVAYPAVPRDGRNTYPPLGAREAGCLGVLLEVIGRRYLPQQIQERPLRLVE